MAHWGNNSFHTTTDWLPSISIAGDQMQLDSDVEMGRSEAAAPSTWFSSSLPTDPIGWRRSEPTTPPSPFFSSAPSSVGSAIRTATETGASSLSSWFAAAKKPEFDDPSPDNRVPGSRRNRRKNLRPRPVKRIKNDDDFFSSLFESEDSDSDSDDDTGGCGNPLCDHRPWTAEEKAAGEHQKPRIHVTEIKSIDDLIELGKSYHCKKHARYHNLDLKIMFNLVVPLGELNSLVGMRKVKRDLVNQIIFFLQGFNTKDRCHNCVDCSFGRKCQHDKNSDMLHTVITGPPGVGKSELGRIIGHIYRAMGILKKGHMKVVKRSDLVGKYLGHTAAKTQSVIDSCAGGVMFIDEAYSLGNKEGRDSFSKECLDTLNQNLTERRDFLCIIAGYKDALERCFFSYNEGLRRRFSFRYDIEGYGAEELRDIFLIKVKKEGWEFEGAPDEKDDPETTTEKQRLMEQLTQFFVRNHGGFPHYGGDVETLVLNAKIYHGRRVLLLEQNAKKKLTIHDIEQGYQTFRGDRKYGELGPGLVKNAMMYT